MGHYAKVVGDTVVQVIVAKQDFIDTLPDKSAWVKTSYNTTGGVHYTEDENGVRSKSTDQSKALRKNYAGVGMKYDKVRDAFIAPQPYPSWTLDESTCLWKPPVEEPDDRCVYNWNETHKRWDKVLDEKATPVEEL
tara:strand:- start:81 stop:488 length:408 start_codon:yes stop_codon:yes gene_type:complete